MPDLLESPDPFTAALERARAGYRSKSRPQLLQPEKSDEHLAKTQDELNLDNPSAFESVLRTVGLGGSAVRNVLKGNVEGVYRNAADLATAGLRALLPGDQSSWELSRKEDLPEFSDVIGGMEPGLAKTGVDLVGGILTDPLSFLGVGEFSAAAKAAKVANAAAKAARGTAGAAEALKAAKVADEALKAARAAGQSKKALGVGLPFMHPAFEIPGSADALAAVGRGVSQVTPPVVKTAANAVGNFARRVTGNEAVADWVKPLLAKARAITGASGEAQTAGLKTALEGVTEDEGRKLFAAIQNVTREGGLENAGGKASSLIPESGLSAPYAATEDVLGRMGGAPSTVLPQSAEEALLMVKKPGMRRNPVTGIDEAVGIEGVAVPKLAGDVLENVTKNPERMWDQVFNPARADQAAAKTLEQAYPLQSTVPKFASGVDIANNKLLRPAAPMAGVRSLKGEQLLAKAIPDVVPESAAVIQGANGAMESIARSTVPAVDQMLGAIPRAGTSRSGAELANVLDATNMAQGGIAPALSKVGAEELPDLLGPWKYHTEQVADIVRGLQAQGIQGEQLAKLTQAAQKWVDYSATQFREAVKAGTFEAPMGRDLLRESPQYAMRMFSGPENEIDQALGKVAGVASSGKARVLKGGESVADFLNANPEQTLESNLGLVGAKRASQQAQGLGKVSLAKDLVDRYAKQATERLARAQSTVDQFQYIPEAERMAKAGLSDAEQLAYKAQWSPLYKAGSEGSDLGAAAKSIIAEIGKQDPETAKVLLTAYEGLPERGWLSKGLAKVNNLFKPYATAGAFIPRINFSVRNVTTGAGGQILSNPEARSQFPRFAKQMAKMVYRSIDDGLEQLTGSRVLRSENELEQFNQALAAGQGSIDQTAALIANPRIREAFQSGVITDGFVQSERLADEIARTGWSKRWRDIRDWPAKIAKGSEQRARLTLFDGLRNDGKSLEEAARITRDTMFDYNMSSVENRTAREVIPFFQFSAKAIPQAAKLLAEKPAVASGLRSLYAQDNATGRPVMPWMQNNVNIPIGTDAAGNPSYLTSFGLPLEALAQIPNPSGNLGDILAQTRQDILGAANPAIKTAVGALSGTDPYFGTPFMSYDKTPEALQALGLPAGGSVGRYYQAASSTGLAQPLTAPIAALSGLLDQRKTATGSAVNALTGLRTVSVDEDQALKQALADAIRRNPNIRSSPNYYELEKSAEGQAILKRLKEVRKSIKAKQADKPLLTGKIRLGQR